MSNQKWFAAAAALVLGLASSVVRAQPVDMPDKDAITGTMNIDFATRSTPDDSGDLKAGSPKLGVQDKYTLDLNIAKTTKFTGSITRQPTLYSSVLHRRKQSAQLQFALNLLVLNPHDLTQSRQVGNWIGELPIDDSGAYLLDGGKKDDLPLRIHVDPVGEAQAFDEAFGGKLVGKAEQKETLTSYTYKRLIGDKEVDIVVKKTDPMRFENMELSKGPAGSYPRTVVNGRLDYDYETGNWLTDGIHFNYSLDGKDYEDVVTGTIKWTEDPDRKTNGKGSYVFNLRFNEDKNKKAGTESDAFKKMSDEDAFFAVDDSVPTLGGTIDYVDTMDGDNVLASKIVFNLTSNKLTKQQVMNFAKLWIIAIGPTNDE